MKKLNFRFNKQLIITLGRQYGAGGRTSAKMLANTLGINYYDDEILKLASEESAIKEEIFRLNDEEPVKNILSIITKKNQLKFNEIDYNNLTSPDNLFKFQSNVIRELAKEDNFIVLGRCANVVLEDQHKDKVLRIYLYADFDTRVERIIKQESISKEDAITKIRNKDKNRAKFYKYFTNFDIFDVDKYDLMINTSTIGFDEILEIIIKFLEVRKFIEILH